MTRRWQQTGRSRLWRWQLPGVLAAVALTTCWGCTSPERSNQAIWPTAIPEIAEATLSPDGRAIAISGFPKDTATHELRTRVYFLDAETGRALAQSPAALEEASLPAWGPGSSYTQTQAVTIGGPRPLYWSPAASDQPTRVPVQYAWPVYKALDAELQHVVVAAITASRSATQIEKMQVMAVPLHGSGPARALLSADEAVALAGVVSDPARAGRSLALVTGLHLGPEGAPGVVALDVDSGAPRWRAALPSAAGGIPHAAQLRSGDVVMSLEAATWGDAQAPGTEVWLLDSIGGTARYQFSIPDSYRFFAFPAGGHPFVYFGGVTGIWRFKPASPSQPPVEVLAGGGTLHPLGVRANASHQIELFMYDGDAVWRHNMSTGRTELMLGHADSSSARPKVLHTE